MDSDDEILNPDSTQTDDVKNDVGIINTNDKFKTGYQPRLILTRLKSYVSGLDILFEHKYGVMGINKPSENPGIKNVLAHLEQEIKNLSEDERSPKKLSALFQFYLGQLETRSIKLVPNPSNYPDLTPESFHKDLMVAEKFYVWKSPREKITTRWEDDEFIFEQIEDPINFTSQVLSDEFNDRANKYWYISMPEWQKNYIDSLNATQFCKSPPAILRHIPGVCNLSQHSFNVINKKNQEVIQTVTSIRSASIYNDEFWENKERLDEGERIAQVNLAHLREYGASQNKPNTLVQSYLSPVIVDSNREGVKEFRKENNNMRMAEMKEKAVNNATDIEVLKPLEKRQDIRTANYPINLHFRPGGLGSTVYNQAFDQVENTTLFYKANERKSDNKMLENAINDYSTLGLEKNSSGRGNFKELFLASLELIIADKAEYCAIGGCQHGKDRTAIINLHRDAMVAYFVRYGNLPKYTDRADSEERANFNKIFAALYFTEHHQKHSSQNSPGSYGIKNINLYVAANTYDYLKSEATKRGFDLHDSEGTCDLNRPHFPSENDRKERPIELELEANKQKRGKFKIKFDECYTDPIHPQEKYILFYLTQWINNKPANDKIYTDLKKTIGSLTNNFTENEYESLAKKYNDSFQKSISGNNDNFDKLELSVHEELSCIMAMSHLAYTQFETAQILESKNHDFLRKKSDQLRQAASETIELITDSNTTKNLDLFRGRAKNSLEILKSSSDGVLIKENSYVQHVLKAETKDILDVIIDWFKKLGAVFNINTMRDETVSSISAGGCGFFKEAINIQWSRRVQSPDSSEDSDESENDAGNKHGIN